MTPTDPRYTRGVGLEIRLLSSFAVDVDGEPVDPARWSRRQAMQLVKLLALAPRLRLPQQDVTQALWPGADPDTAGNGLNKVVHLARHALEPKLAAGNDSRFLVRSDGQIALTSPDGVRVDAVEFDRLAGEAIGTRDERLCRAALALYDGDLLPADRWADWAARPRERLRSQRLRVQRTLAELLAARGEIAEAITQLQELLGVDETIEAAHRALMQCFLRAGDRSRALRQFEHCRAALRRELDAEPEAATRELFARIAGGSHADRDNGAGGAGGAGGAAAAPAAARPGSLAVLPFANLTGDPGREYLANGVAESLIRVLSRQASLRVMAPSTVLRYRGREPDPRAVGRELSVAMLLLGRLEQWRENFVLCVELVRTTDGSLLWGERFDRPQRDLVDVVTVIADAASRRLSDGDAAPAAASTRVPQAYEHYLRGRHEWNRRTATALGAAIAHFERAIAADPHFALAHSGLADCHALSGLYSAAPPLESMPRARAAAQRAIELDPQLAEAHTSLAYVRFAFAWDFAAAERGFDAAHALAPSYATAWQWHHELLAALGRVEAQREAVARARELDPLSPIIATEVGWGLYFAREFAAAHAHLERVVATAPEFPVAWLVLGLVQLGEGDSDAARDTLRHAHQLCGDAPFPLVLGALGHAHATAGDAAAADTLLRELRALAPGAPAAEHAAALVHCGRGRAAEAIAALRRAFDGRADRLVFLRVEPLFDPLRALPEFDALCARLQPAHGP